MMLREHDVRDNRCVRCGALKPGEHSTCVPRRAEVSVLRPEPARREYAIDDTETISGRIAELRAESEAAANPSVDTCLDALLAWGGR